MKKYFYLAAVSAMMLTACSSENDVVQPTTAQPTNPVAVQQQAVAFDTYLSGTTASTRAGDPEGVITTDLLKAENKGFGVFAMYTGTDNYGSSTAPNFMYNEHVSWNNGWAYSPLKYWPNETTKDSQSPAATASDLEKLSFFAYAPYVDLSTTGNMATSSTTTEPAYKDLVSAPYGIIGITQANRANDPLVEWQARYSTSDNTWRNDILDHNVDLLWGVAPNGMDYTAVNGNTVDTDFGMPLVNLVKPNKDQKIKFLFQHALSRIGLSVVSAIDQISAGDDGGKFTTADTRVLIEEVTVWGDFGVQGVLNLNNNEENKANWIWASVAKAQNNATYPILLVNATNGNLATDLRYNASAITTISTGGLANVSTNFAALGEGVIPSEKPLCKQGLSPDKAVSNPTYAYGTTIYKYGTGNVLEVATATTPTGVAVYSYAGSTYTQVDADGSMSVDGSTQYYSVSAATATIVSGSKYLTTGDAGATYTENTAGTDISGNDLADKYLATPVTATYAPDTYYTAVEKPRYFMVIPSEQPATESTKTSVTVKIKYHVITKDTKLASYVSDITNEITKTEKFQFESGKSYNLKLILGLTSVKLDAVVGDWQVGDDAEVYLPKNN